MLRDIIKIDDEKCNGCGLCVPNCHEGALQVIDGKVRLVSELMCDGLGAHRTLSGGSNNNREA
jgi:ferredoxin